VIVLAVWLASTRLDLSQVSHALARIRLGWVLVGVALMAGSFMARSESWFAVIWAAVPARAVGRSTVRRGLLIGLLGSALAPGRAGEAARAWIVTRRLGPIGDFFSVVLGTVLAQTLLNVVALALLAVLASAGIAAGILRVSAIIVAVLLPAGILTALFAGPPLLAGVASGSGRRSRAAGWMLRQVRSIRSGLRAFRRPIAAAHATGFQLLAWGLQMGTCYATLLAFHGLPATIPVAAAVLVAVNLTAIVPLTPSNVGVFQAACIAVLVPLRVAAGVGLAYGLVLQAIEIGTVVALGVPSVLREGLSWDQIRAGGAAAPPAPPAPI
jgi:phosphatidylinositol alpha-mannosyltransferase